MISSHDPLVSVVMPCLNEEEALAPCIEKIQRAFQTAGIDGEIVGGQRFDRWVGGHR